MLSERELDAVQDDEAWRAVPREQVVDADANAAARVSARDAAPAIMMCVPLLSTPEAEGIVVEGKVKMMKVTIA